jgi:hypothetical protein
LERKLSKRLRKLDGKHADEPVDDGAIDEHAAAVLARAEREAAEIRRAARRDRDRFREELVDLLSRLAPEPASDDDSY